MVFTHERRDGHSGPGDFTEGKTLTQALQETYGDDWEKYYDILVQKGEEIQNAANAYEQKHPYKKDLLLPEED